MSVKFIHDPDAVLDYTLDWSKWLVSDDFLVHATFTPDPILNVLSVNIADSIETPRTNVCATVWLSVNSGYQLNVLYPVICHITSDGGRQDDRTFYILLREI